MLTGALLFSRMFKQRGHRQLASTVGRFLLSRPIPTRPHTEAPLLHLPLCRTLLHLFLHAVYRLLTIAGLRMFGDLLRDSLPEPTTPDLLRSTQAPMVKASAHAS